MRAGGYFSYFIVKLIALLNCFIRVLRSEIPIMKFHVGVIRSMPAVTINYESNWPGLIRSGKQWWRWWILVEGTTCSGEALSIYILLKLDKKKDFSNVKLMFQVFRSHTIMMFQVFRSHAKIMSQVPHKQIVALHLKVIMIRFLIWYQALQLKDQGGEQQ